MVAGADKFLEMNSNGNSRVTVTVSNEVFTDSRVMVNPSVGVDKEMLKTYNHPLVENGGYYNVIDNNFEMWLCPTLLYVFESEEYPDAIYFKFINN